MKKIYFSLLEILELKRKLEFKKIKQKCKTKKMNGAITRQNGLGDLNKRFYDTLDSREFGKQNKKGSFVVPGLIQFHDINVRSHCKNQKGITFKDFFFSGKKINSQLWFTKEFFPTMML
jgi:hypothetical protein